MSQHALDAMRAIIQEDVGNRGLRTDPEANLITACRDDLHAACRSLAEAEAPALGVVTGFYIPHAEPPCGETDGPLGALFLARALLPLGMRIALITDAFCRQALAAGLEAAGLAERVPLVVLPEAEQAAGQTARDYWQALVGQAGPLTHLLALERAGPSHTPASVRAQSADNHAAFLAEVPAERHDRCHTMKGRDITARMSPAHLLFEGCAGQQPRVTTIGIGDGGNEIGMGKIPWHVVRANIPGGGVVACRVATDYLIVCGVSNWGAYGLAAGVRWLRGAAHDQALFDPERERHLLRVMVEQGPLVDGVTGRPTVTVDGLPFERYVEPLRRLGAILASC